MNPTLLLLAEAPDQNPQAGLALADDWRRETGREALWCWPSQFDMPEVLASALVRRMPACITPGAAI
ncbi:MAG TPA: hypothetical protein VH105_19280, partial [Burkholderiales bacterium]|nr:hypothetical protein [Burkholderiales bacterium]